MKRLLKIFFLLLVSSHTYAAQCDLQKNFTSSFKIDGKYLIVEIHRLDAQNFKYYTIGKNDDSSFIGFHFTDKRTIIFGSRELSYVNLGSPSFQISSRDEEWNKKNLQQIIDFFANDYDVTKFRNFRDYATFYPVPLETYKTVKSYNKKIDLEQFISMQKVVLDYNKISGTQTIKFYVKFLHDQIPIECSYFESPPIELDLDTVKGYDYP